jgi:hypothetical protein
METEVKEHGRDRKLTCDELKTTDDFQRATVTRESLQVALEKTFGKDQIEDPQDYILVVPANHGGLRSDLSELERGGIREHACDILDGGEEAFRKRKRKYKIT